jgi:RNase H-like domain found in reverse transcriptase/Integrase zinc binding domain
MGTVSVGTGAVWEKHTRGIPVLNPTNYLKTIEPLSQLTRSVPFIWTNVQQMALEALQKILISSPALRLSNNEDPFRISSNASLVASGGLLEQCQDGKWYPIVFTSKMFSQTERRYNTYDREFLGIIHALEEWRPLIVSSRRKTQVLTDHVGLKFFKEPQALSHRHAQWSMQLADYNIEIAYVKGAHNSIVDALSRSQILDPEEIKRDKVITLLPKDLWLPDNSVKISRMILTTDERTTLLQEAHDHVLAGHPSIAQTIKNLGENTWQGRDSDVKEYVNHCPECQWFKIRRSCLRGILYPLPPATFPFE